MAEEHIPMEDVQRLWGEMTEHSWEELDRLGHEKEKQGSDMEATTVRDLLGVAERLRGQPFPNNPEELYEVLNSHAEVLPHR
jgi:hypothetical protein